MDWTSLLIQSDPGSVSSCEIMDLTWLFEIVVDLMYLFKMSHNSILTLFFFCKLASAVNPMDWLFFTASLLLFWFMIKILRMENVVVRQNLVLKCNSKYKFKTFRATSM